MTCKICGSNQIHTVYCGKIRNGGVGKYTSQKVSMYQCDYCGVIWHDTVVENLEQYYESKQYRDSLNEASEELFYQLHDKETLDKLQYTGTEIFRGKTVADIGCGAGAFLDYLKGVAKNIVAVEPSEMFRGTMTRKGFSTYPYTKDAFRDWFGKVDVVTSFDVIEHVEDPLLFLKETYDLLAHGVGTAIIGTPTEAPVMRRLLGENYEKEVLFSVQHLWIFSENSLRELAKQAGFSEIKIRYFQRYGIENLLGWCLEKQPNSEFHDPFFSGEIDAVWRSACSAHKASDYVVLYANK